MLPVFHIPSLSRKQITRAKRSRQNLLKTTASLYRAPSNKIFSKPCSSVYVPVFLYWKNGTMAAVKDSILRRTYGKFLGRPYQWNYIQSTLGSQSLAGSSLKKFQERYVKNYRYRWQFAPDGFIIDMPLRGNKTLEQLGFSPDYPYPALWLALSLPQDGLLVYSYSSLPRDAVNESAVPEIKIKTNGITCLDPLERSNYF